MNIPTIGTYVKVKRDLPNRDYILSLLRGKYGSSTKKAFKVVGYNVRENKIELVLEDTWGSLAYLPNEYFEVK